MKRVLWPRCLGLALVSGLVLTFADARPPEAMAQEETAPFPRPVTDPSAAPLASSFPPAAPCVGQPGPQTNPPAPFDPPTAVAGDKPLPINLAVALKLANAQAWDIAIASRRVQAAAAQFAGGLALALPTIYTGIDWTHHDGAQQNLNTADILDISRTSFMVGTAPFAVFATTDAIFEPLVARQNLRARRADVRTAANDITMQVAQAYFNVEEARGDLASAVQVTRDASEIVSRVEKIAPELVPRVEVARARTQLQRYEQLVQSARERWRVASADLAYLVRLDAEILVEPVEPPHLQVTLIAPQRSLDDLIAMALTYRPELASYQAQVQAALLRWRQERLRPLLPIILARGAGTQTPFPMAFGAFGGGQGNSLSNFGLRDDFDIQALWELRGFGLGNLALMRGRRAEYQAAELQLFRTQAQVAREVAQAYAQLQSAAARVGQAERGLEEALISVKGNYEGLGQLRRVGGNINVLVIRPQEALASVQDLSQAYFNYYGAVADYNRSQFRLYRAMGNPAPALLDSGIPPLPCEQDGGKLEPARAPESIPENGRQEAPENRSPTTGTPSVDARRP